MAPPEWQWGYNRMTTVKGLFTAGDGVGASGHKFSSGSFAEGRIAGKSMIRFARDNKDFKPTVNSSKEQLAAEIYKPFQNYLDHKDYTTDPMVNPNIIRPRSVMFRLNKMMDEYVAGTSTYYTTSEKLMDVALHLLGMLKEDAGKMGAKDLHELLRAWENYHRIWTAEMHLRHIYFRKETRYPGFYYRSDYPKLDEVEWKCFVNSRFDPKTKEWAMKKAPHMDLVPKG
jgi:adenylylsulfate reductase subunit A